MDYADIHLGTRLKVALAALTAVCLILLASMPNPEPGLPDCPAARLSHVIRCAP